MKKDRPTTRAPDERRRVHAGTRELLVKLVASRGLGAVALIFAVSRTTLASALEAHRSPISPAEAARLDRMAWALVNEHWPLPFPLPDVRAPRATRSR